MEESYKYFAFISYSHRDEKWARFIQNELEGYKLPNVIRKEAKRELPKRIRPVFRDATDLGVGLLEDNLKAELAASKYLIVICSPNSASENADGKCWVDSEVNYFCRELDRGNRIIPIIIEGTPNDAFCKTLKQMECLALDATKHQKARIVNDVVAKILGLKPDDLWQRELRRRRRQLMIRALSALALSGVCAFGGWYGWDWTREKTAYFTDYVDRFGVPEGICPLRPEQVVGRGQAYRFHYRGYDSFLPGTRRPVLRKVFCVNSFDHIRNESNVRPLHPQAAGLRFHYDEKLTIAKVEHLEVDGTVKATFRYSGLGAGIVDVIRRGGDGRLGTVARILPITGKDAHRDEIGRYHIARDERGHVIRTESYRDARGVPAADGRGVHRTDYRLDGAGRVVSESYYSWSGQRVLCGVGVDEMQYVYDATGNIGELHGVKDGKRVFSTVYEYDARGNCTKTEKESHDVACPVKGWVEQRKAYDEHGEMVRLEHFDANGNAAKYTDSRWERKVRFEDGCLVEEDVSYFDEKGDVGQVNGVARCVMRYDGNMRNIETIRHGMDGKLLDSPKLAAIVRRKFDNEGRMVECSTIGPDGKEWVDPEHGWSVCRHRYVLEHDILVQTTSYFRCAEGRLSPVEELGTGAETEEMSYDTKGRVFCIRLFGANGKAVANHLNWHKTQFKFDRYGFLAEIAYWDADGKPVLASGWGAFGVVAAVRFVNDAVGNALETSLFDVDGKLMVGKDGYAKLKKKYDARGRLIEVELLDVDGNPVEPKGGVNCRSVYFYDDNDRKAMDRCYSLDGSYGERKFDENGKELSSACFSADGLPKADENGVHVILYRRDANGREVKKGYLDIHGKPVLNEERIAGLSTAYDESGSVIEEVRFGTKGELVRDINGVCIVRWKYDGQHREVARDFYDTHTNLVENKNGVAGIRRTYDEEGNLTEEYSIEGVRGLAKPDSNGVAITHREHDRLGRVVKRTFYDAMRKPVLGKDLIAGWKSEYEGDSNHETARLFFGLDGKPCKCAAGHAGWIKEYDERGNVTKFMQVDERGNPVLGQDGTAGWLQKYDMRNRIVEARWIGEDGNPCGQHLDFSAFGAGVVTGKCAEAHYDVQGRMTAVIVLEEERDGISRIVQKKNLAGDVVELRFEGRDGALVGLPNGVARVESSYNSFHALTERKWFDVDGRPGGMDGVCRRVIQYEYSPRGLRQRSICYNADGFPVNSSDGCAFSDEVYDSEYRLVRCETRDATGNLACAKGRKWAYAEWERDARGLITKFTSYDEKGGGAIFGCVRIEVAYSFSDKGELAGGDFKGYDAKGNLRYENKVDVHKAMEWSRSMNAVRYQPIK